MTIQVRVQNFQAIEDETLEIDGFTAVTGPNNTGKSSLVRAFVGAFSNMGGDDFVRHGARYASVEITFQDGRTVLWEKGKGVNRYVIDGKTYKYVGHGPPAELAALGVCPIVVNGKSLWPQIAHQHTGQVFLLDQSGSVVAESVADVERVGKLNRALKRSESERRETTSKLKIRRADVKKLKGEYDKFEGLDEMLVDMSDIQSKIDRNNRIGKLYEQLTTLQIKIHRTKTTVDFLAGVGDISIPDKDLVTKITKRVEALEVLRALRVRFESMRSKLDFFQSHQKSLDEITILDTSFEELVVQTNKARKALAVVGDLQKRYRKAEERCNHYNDLLGKKQKELLDVTGAIESILGDMTTCPVCKSQIVNHEV